MHIKCVNTVFKQPGIYMTSLIKTVCFWLVLICSLIKLLGILFLAWRCKFNFWKRANSVQWVPSFVLLSNLQYSRGLPIEKVVIIQKINFEFSIGIVLGSLWENPVIGMYRLSVPIPIPSIQSSELDLTTFAP